MKFINLVFDGIANQKGTIDFAGKVASSLSVTNLDKDVLQEALCFALFGANGDFAKLTIPARAELLFSAEDAEYMVIRMFDKPDTADIPQELAIVTDIAQKTIFAEGVDGVNAFIADKSHFTKKGFTGWFCIKKEELASVLSADFTTRESYVAVAIDKVTTADEVNANIADLKEQEQAIMAHIEAIAPISRKEIKNFQLTVDTNQIEVDNIRKDISIDCDNIAKIKEYDTDTQAYFEKSNSLEKLLARDTDIANKTKTMATSQAAKEVANIFKDYLAVTEDVALSTKAIAAKESELAELDTNVAAAEVSAKKLEKDFIYHNEKSAELDKALRTLIKDSAANPQNYNVKAGVNNYYKDVDQHIAALVSRKATVDSEFNALTQSIALLNARKLTLRTSPLFKKTITEAAIIEGDLKWQDAATKNIASIIETYETQQNALYEEHTALSKKLATLKDEQEKLEKVILGKYPNYKEAVNADVVYKQTLYAKHLIVSSNEVELDVILKKIDSVKTATAHYEERLANATARKAELEEHIGKLNARLVLLDEKYTEYASINKLRDLTDNIVYGSHCPVCNGFVTSKTDFEGKDTKALEAQIISINAEIDKSSATLDEILESIGQYGAAKMVSSQYLSSLIETADAKRKIIDTVLAEYSANSVGQLFAKLKIAIIKSNELTNNLDKFRDTQITLSNMMAKDQNLMSAYDKLGLVIAEKKVAYEAAIQDMRAKTATYAGFQSVLNGENAENLVLKQQILDVEYATCENDQEAQTARLDEVRAERDELTNAILMLSNRAITVDVNGNKYDYLQVVTQVIMKDLNILLTEIEQNVEAIDVSKVRLASIRKFVSGANEKKANLSAEVLAEQTRIATASKVATDMYSKYESKVTDLGVNTQEQIDALILDDATAEKFASEISTYNNNIIMLTETINNLQAAISDNQNYSNNKEVIFSHYQDLKAKEQSAIIALGRSQAEKDDMVARYNDIIDSNKKLAYLQGRIKGIDDLKAAISNGAIIAKDCAKLIIDKANALVKNWSNDGYYLDSKADGSIVLINNAKGKEVKADKYTKAEKMLMLLGLSLAYSTSLSALVGCDYVGAISVGADENDKSSVSIMVTAGKEQELIAIPLDEASFMRTASKL